MKLLDEKLWTARIFNTAWSDADGGIISVLEPATGDELAIEGPKAGLDLLSTLDIDKRMIQHHRLLSVRAHLLEKTGDLPGGLRELPASRA